MFSRFLAAAVIASSITHCHAQATGGNSSNGVVSSLDTGKGCKFAGVNIPGFDFGPNNGGVPDGPKQMQHYVNDDKLNIFRLPVEWDYLVAAPGQPLLAERLGQYDDLMQSCLATGAYCILDIHSYARWGDMHGNQIIAQGGPSTEQFVDLWTQLAKKYATDEKVIMGIMNEPYGVDIQIWAQVVQAAVTAIRGAGATKQMMLLPGTDYTNPALWVSDGSGAALTQIVNPGCSDSDTACKYAGLIFDFHYYFGYDTECSNNGIENAWTPPLALMRQDPNNIRQGMVTEIGGGPHSQSCLTNVCQALDFMNENSDVYLGWTAWAAGAFTTANAMFLLDDNGNDLPLMTQCFAGKAYGGLGPGSTAPGLGVSQGTSSGTGSPNAQGLVANETGTSGASQIFGSGQPQTFATEPNVTNSSSTSKKSQSSKTCSNMNTASKPRRRRSHKLRSPEM